MLGMYVYSGIFSSRPQATMFALTTMHRQEVTGLQWWLLTGLNCIVSEHLFILAIIESLVLSYYYCYTEGVLLYIHYIATS